MTPSAVFDFLQSRSPLFAEFPQERLRELVAGSRLTTFEPNEAVIEFGEEGRFMGILIEGEALASTTDDAGEQHRIGMLRAGDTFGEMSLMTGDKTMADVIGVTRCTALLIPKALFATAILTHPPAIQRLSRTITERLRVIAYENKGRDLAASALRRSDDPYGLELRTDEPAKILVINCGSSSLKYNLFDTADEQRNARGSIECIGQSGTIHTYRRGASQGRRELPAGTHRDAFADMMQMLLAPDGGPLRSVRDVTAVGHRVVHGGQTFSSPVLITDDVVREIEAAAHLAPLHNFVNLTGICEARRLLPQVPHVAVFDTAFHQTMPPYAYLYGLPYEYFERKGIRRYGFHGPSHLYVALKAAQFLKRPFNELEIVSCHLGNGASVCAVDHSRSVDTSMGLTPAEGLIMGTRAGSFDPAILLLLMNDEKLTSDAMDRIINHESGLKGMSGLSNDMREVEKAAEAGHHRALLAVKSFSYQVRKYIGAYMAAMGGIDALIFTGGIGQGSASTRSLACQGLSCMGIVINEKMNRLACGRDDVCDISAADATVLYTQLTIRVGTLGRGGVVGGAIPTNGFLSRDYTSNPV